MDGGARQREMADRIKAEVRQKASQRRERQLLEMRGADVGVAGNGDVDHRDTSGWGTTEAGDTVVSPGSHGVELSPESGPTNSVPPLEVVVPRYGAAVQDSLDKRPDERPSGEMHLLMIYLDYVFPYLFPHYNPPILAGGRGWVLDILNRNKTVYHSAVSLASFFFAIALADGDKAHEECTTEAAVRLGNQLELGLQELQKEMRIIIDDIEPVPDKERRLVVMLGIIQMLLLEVATARNDNWMLHLDAAVGMFQQILPAPAEWTTTLKHLYSAKWPPPEFGTRRPWSANQAALRFFTATLLYTDILSSITLGTEPRLTKYHADIIPNYSFYERSLEPLRAGPLSVDEFLGLPNWIVRVLGDVAILAHWKWTRKQSGSLSMTELVSRGLVLSDVIHRGLRDLESEPESQHTAAQPFSLLVSGSARGHVPDQQPKYQIIWLLATLSYLNVVISGWQPSSTDIRWSVSKATGLFSQLPNGSGVRTLAWPLCISGCLSPPQDEAMYRALAQRWGGSLAFGSMKQALDTMESVWSMRGHIEETWDVAQCFNVLGHGVLLI